MINYLERNPDQEIGEPEPLSKIDVRFSK